MRDLGEEKTRNEGVDELGGSFFLGKLSVCN